MNLDKIKNALDVLWIDAFTSEAVRLSQKSNDLWELICKKQSLKNKAEALVKHDRILNECNK